MTAIDDFLESLKHQKPEVSVPPLLQALWYDARGDWDRAHQIVQKESGADAAWVHAYLHRKEGDLANAGYWYRRTKREVASDTLEDEWRSIVSALIAQNSSD